jgi:hypothetical protein
MMPHRRRAYQHFLAWHEVPPWRDRFWHKKAPSESGASSIVSVLFVASRPRFGESWIFGCGLGGEPDINPSPASTMLRQNRLLNAVDAIWFRCVTLGVAAARVGVGLTPFIIASNVL